MPYEQLPLFSEEPPVDADRAPTTGPSATSPLSVATERFGDHLVAQDYAKNTVKSFLGDLRILAGFLQDDQPIAEIGTPELERFLHWLRHDRGKPCSPKSYARRLTSLKAFFGWLRDTGVLSSNPAAGLVHRPVKTPLPRVLSDNQLQEVLTVTRSMMDGDKPDPRPHLLVSLLVHTGIKKQECMAIKLAHLDASNPSEMVLHVRYADPRMLHKERRLRLPDGWGQTLAEYRGSYDPEEYLFPCTARNLEYVLANVAKGTSLLEGLSFETLRWTCAVRDHKTGMDADLRRRKLGLSKTSWKETESRLIRLAEPPL
ncbi:tyrosine-type recombinase/integrase [Chloroflexota bacterium]